MQAVTEMRNAGLWSRFGRSSENRDRQRISVARGGVGSHAAMG